MPVAPIFEPEVGARAIAAVAEKPRRRSWIGEPTLGTVMGNRLAAGLMDVFLAKTGYSGQQAPQKKEPMLPDNLYEPTAGDHGARGIFSDQAHSTSPQVWYTEHRGIGRGLAVAAALGAGFATVRAVSGRRR